MTDTPGLATRWRDRRRPRLAGHFGVIPIIHAWMNSITDVTVLSGLTGTRLSHR